MTDLRWCTQTRLLLNSLVIHLSNVFQQNSQVFLRGRNINIIAPRQILELCGCSVSVQRNDTGNSDARSSGAKTGDLGLG